MADKHARIASFCLACDLPRMSRPRKERPAPLPDDPEARAVHLRALARRITDSRTQRGWTPGDLAYRAGISPQALRSIEAAKTEPGTWTMQRLADALSVSAGWLAFGG